MLDGSYKMEMDTPLGLKKGTLDVRTEGEKAFLHVDAPLIGKKQFECQANGDEFDFDGSFKLKLIGTITFKAHGTVEGDDIHVALETDKGTFQINGTRV